MSFSGSLYCIGFIYGVNQTLYGVGVPVVLQAVTVIDVQVNAVVVSGGPSCGPEVWGCGQTVPSLAVTPNGLRVNPGDVINLYGITTTTSLTPTGAHIVGYCNPDFGC